jgi:hypothetical protein
MRKTSIGISLLAAGALGMGYLLSQVGAPSPVFAAAKKHATSKTARSHATTKTTHSHATGSTATQHADGTVQAVNGDTITVKADADQAGSNEYTKVTTIVLTSSTKYDTGNGTTSTTRPTIAAGSYIIAEGTVSSDGSTLTATLVSTHAGGRGHGGPGGGGPHADGTVQSVSGNTITVTPDADRAGSNEYTKVTTIVLTSTTQYEAGHGATTTTRPTIANGNHIVADGTLNSDGTSLTATKVEIDSGGPGGH